MACNTAAELTTKPGNADVYGSEPTEMGI